MAREVKIIPAVHIFDQLDNLMPPTSAHNGARAKIATAKSLASAVIPGIIDGF
jgi:hypothetical protein